MEMIVLGGCGHHEKQEPQLSLQKLLEDHLRGADPASKHQCLLDAFELTQTTEATCCNLQDSIQSHS